MEMIQFLEENRRNIIILFITGLVIGAISGELFNWLQELKNSLEQLFYAYIFCGPGLIFGIGLSLFLLTRETRNLWIPNAAIITTCCASYFIAFCTAVFILKSTNPISFGFAALISTTIMMAILQLLLRVYSFRSLVLICLAGGLIAAILFPLTRDIHQSDIFLFLLGWQSVMFVFVGLPIMQYESPYAEKNTNE